jgi:isocitrate dehydrogenase (NAD+)
VGAARPGPGESALRVGWLPGDGIGPIVLAEARRVLDAVGFAPTWVPLPFGLAEFDRTGAALPDATVATLAALGVGLLGAATTPDAGCRSPILALRRRLGLDLLVRPARGPGIDAVVIGHAFEGLYGEPEDEGPPAVARWVVTPAGADRLVAAAFATARTKVTLVDKPTVLRGAARLFREAAARHARPGIAFELVNADAFAAALVRDPSRWDVIAATSLLSDLFSDLCAELAGGVGVAPSASLGPGCAIFEPVHGSAPRRAAEVPARVNPTGAILAGALLLDHVGEGARAERVRSAVAVVRATLRTPDEGGDATTAELGAAIAMCAAAPG